MKLTHTLLSNEGRGLFHTPEHIVSASSTFQVTNEVDRLRDREYLYLAHSITGADQAPEWIAVVQDLWDPNLYFNPASCWWGPLATPHIDIALARRAGLLLLDCTRLAGMGSTTEALAARDAGVHVIRVVLDTYVEGEACSSPFAPVLFPQFITQTKLKQKVDSINAHRGKFNGQGGVFWHLLFATNRAV